MPKPELDLVVAATPQEVRARLEAADQLQVDLDGAGGPVARRGATGMDSWIQIRFYGHPEGARVRGRLRAGKRVKLAWWGWSALCAIAFFVVGPRITAQSSALAAAAIALLFVGTTTGVSVALGARLRPKDEASLLSTVEGTLRDHS